MNLKKRTRATKIIRSIARNNRILCSRLKSKIIKDFLWIMQIHCPKWIGYSNVPFSKKQEKNMLVEVKDGQATIL